MCKDALDAIRISIGIAWRLTVSAMALAIVFGRGAGLATPANRATLTDSHLIRVEENPNCFRIFTQLDSDKDTLHIELFDPHGRKNFHFFYSNDGLAYSFMQTDNVVKVGYAKRPGGGESVHVRTPGACYSVGLHSNGESNVNVVASENPQQWLGQIRVSSDGKRQPDGDDANAQKPLLRTSATP